MDSIQVALKGPRNESVPAVVRSINLMRDGLAWFVSWFPKMFDLSGRRLFQDSHWDVPAIWTEANSNPGYRVKVIEANDEIQGFLVAKVHDYIGIDDKPCAYVSFIASAPWNRKLEGAERRYGDVGKILISIAVLYSVKFCQSYCVELHALSEAEDFYRRIGMKETGRTKGNLKEFRLEKPESLALARLTLPQ